MEIHPEQVLNPASYSQLQVRSENAGKFAIFPRSENPEAI